MTMLRSVVSGGMKVLGTLRANVEEVDMLRYKLIIAGSRCSRSNSGREYSPFLKELRVKLEPKTKAMKGNMQ